MRINIQDFKEFAPRAGLHKVGLHAIERAHVIMSKFYCDKMTMRSLCPRECGKCALMLKHSVASISPEVKNPYAVFTWLMKNEFAKAGEAAAKAHKVEIKMNPLGERIESDGFDQLMEAFGG
jgi:hypothetical protein